MKFIDEGCELREEGLMSLDSLFKFIEMTKAKIEVGGHTDNIGLPSEKQKLSEMRAKVVCEYLKSKHKISEANLTYKGYGSTMPIATNRTPEGRTKNNRIEIKILSTIPYGRLEFIQGKILFHKRNISEPVEISRSCEVTLFDRILTDSLGRANLRFDGVVIKILPNSDVSINNLDGFNKNIEIYLKTGKIIVDVTNKDILIVTPTCSVSTNRGKFVFQSDMYYQDVISVWSESVSISANGFSEVINEDYGTVCYYGKRPAPARLLPPSPVLDTTIQKDYLVYNEKKQFKFLFTRPEKTKVHFLLGRDPEFDDVIYETITESESCSVKSVDLPRVYLWLNSIDESGFESKSARIYSFEIVNPKRRYTGPVLEITKKLVERRQGETIVLIEGKTDPESALLINGVKVKVQKDWAFSFRAKIPYDTQFIELSAIDKKGRKTSIQISVAKKQKIEIDIGGGLSMLAGGGLDASKIGYVFGGNFGYSLTDKMTIGLSAHSCIIGCKTKEWEPEGSHFKTYVYIGVVRIKYWLNPFANLSLYAGAEFGGGYWKSLYDNSVYNWAINPYGGGNLGLKKDISQRISLFGELSAGYLRNKDKPNMGTRDINYILPRGLIGVIFNF